MGRIKNVMIISVPGVDNETALRRIGELREKYQSKGQYGDKVLDFQKVLPMPEALFNSPAGPDADKSYYIYTKINGLPCNENVTALYEKELVEQSKLFNFRGVDAYERFLESLARDPRNKLDISVGKELYENEKRFGARNWEDFHEKTWGTRFNCMNSQELGCDTLIFETDKVAAHHIFDRIAKDNPDVELMCAAVNTDDYKDGFVAHYTQGVMDKYNIPNETGGAYIMECWEGNEFHVDDCYFSRLQGAVNGGFLSHSTDYQVLQNILPDTPMVEVKKEPVKTLVRESDRESTNGLGRKFGSFLEGILNNKGNEVER